MLLRKHDSIGENKEINHREKSLMAYVYMPLLFIVLGYGIVYLCVKPHIGSLSNIGLTFLNQNAPTESGQNNSIYVEPDESFWEEQPETIQASDVVKPKYGEIYGKITCEEIQLEAEILFGDNDTLLKSGVGQYIGSFLPGYGRQILLTGHNTTYFRALENVKKGDILVVSTSYGRYQYEVTETKVVSKGEPTPYDIQQEEEKLILCTEYPFGLFAGDKEDSFYVCAKKIAGPKVEE